MNLKKLSHILFGIFVCVLLISPNLISAQAYRGLIFSSLEYQDEPTGKLIFDIDLVEPGSSVKGTFVITHDFDNNNQPVTVIPRAVDFTQGENPGSPRFLDSDELPESARLSEWIVFDNPAYTLDERGDTTTVGFTINVPANADAGGKFAGILLSRTGVTTGNDSDENVNFDLNGETGPLVLLTVNGDVSKQINLDEIYTTDINNDRAWFFFNLPVNLVANFSNTGNTYVAPRGRVIIHRGEDYTNSIDSYDLNPEEDGYRDYIIPDTNRKFSVTWNESFIKYQPDGKGGYETIYDFDNLSKLRIGQYTFTLLYDYVDATGTTVNLPVQQISVWVIPLPLIVFFVLLIILVVSYIVARQYRKRDTSKNKK